VKAIYQRAQILERFPNLGQADRSPSGRDVQLLIWGHYRIVYMPAGAVTCTSSVSSTDKGMKLTSVERMDARTCPRC
jgi:hypothetical protein